MSSNWYGALFDQNLVMVNVSVLCDSISSFEATRRVMRIVPYKFLMSASLETLVPSDSVLDGVFTQMKIISESFMVCATSVVKVMFLLTRTAFYDCVLKN